MVMISSRRRVALPVSAATTMSPLSTVSFESGDARIVEMAVAREGHGWSIAELEQHGDVRVAAVRRGDKIRIPTPNDTVLRGDIVVAALTGKATRRLLDIMTNPIDAQAGRGARRG